MKILDTLEKYRYHCANECLKRIDAVIEIVAEADLTPEQRKFATDWTHKHFGQVTACQNRDQADVHWRMFLRDGKTLVSHLSLTEMIIQLDDEDFRVGSIGSLFTISDRMGEGFAGELMTLAEDFLLQQSQFPMALLFCLPALVPFYKRRGWRRVTTPVTLAQASGEILTWSEECMILENNETRHSFSQLHVPLTAGH